MLFTGELATLQLPGVERKIELKACEFGYSLGKAGIELESPEGMRATGRFVVDLVLEVFAEFLIGRTFASILTDNDMLHNLGPEEQEAVMEIRQEVYTAVVRRGIQALGEGRLR